MDPTDHSRFPRDVRWPGVLRSELGDTPDEGDGYEVIEEGLPGRTTVWDDPVEGPMNGKSYLLPCLLSHRPIDAVVLLLGSNDLKMRFSVPASDIAAGAGALCDIVLTSGCGAGEQPPKLVLLAPPPLGALKDLSGMFAGGPEKSRELGRHYSAIAAERGLPFLDLGTLFHTSDTDGVHFEADQHALIGREVARTLRELV
jgi:lysophospholipase L1-like esterase